MKHELRYWLQNRADHIYVRAILPVFNSLTGDKPRYRQIDTGVTLSVQAMVKSQAFRL